MVVVEAVDRQQTLAVAFLELFGEPGITILNLPTETGTFYRILRPERHEILEVVQE